MIKDKQVPIFIIIFSIFLVLFENSIFKIISLNQSHLLSYNNPVVNFEIVKNSGAAWGILQNSKIFLILFASAVILLVFFYAIKNLTFKDKKEVLSAALFLGGTFGNVIERIRFGYVFDYIKIQFINFPTFNLFDICIVIGIFVFVVSSLIKGKAK